MNTLEWLQIPLLPDDAETIHQTVVTLQKASEESVEQDLQRAGAHASEQWQGAAATAFVHTHAAAVRAVHGSLQAYQQTAVALRHYHSAVVESQKASHAASRALGEVIDGYARLQQGTARSLGSALQTAIANDPQAAQQFPGAAALAQELLGWRVPPDRPSFFTPSGCLIAPTSTEIEAALGPFALSPLAKELNAAYSLYLTLEEWIATAQINELYFSVEIASTVVNAYTELDQVEGAGCTAASEIESAESEQQSWFSEFDTKMNEWSEHQFDKIGPIKDALLGNAYFHALFDTADVAAGFLAGKGPSYFGSLVKLAEKKAGLAEEEKRLRETVMTAFRATTKGDELEKNIALINSTLPKYLDSIKVLPDIVDASKDFAKVSEGMETASKVLKFTGFFGDAATVFDPDIKSGTMRISIRGRRVLMPRCWRQTWRQSRFQGLARWFWRRQE